jgi:hypothetical protein
MSDSPLLLVQTFLVSEDDPILYILLIILDVPEDYPQLPHALCHFQSLLMKKKIALNNLSCYCGAPDHCSATALALLAL